jgi:hypothetical protein
MGGRAGALTILTQIPEKCEDVSLQKQPAVRLLPKTLCQCGDRGTPHIPGLDLPEHV